jgi:hypothetical protein
MVRPRSPLPPPLPPEQRTVGQLVAETIRLYGDRFWPSLALGLGPALLYTIVFPLPRLLQIPVVAGAGAVLMTSSYVGGTLIASRVRPAKSELWNAFVVGFLIWPPAALLPLVFAVTGNVWIGLLGLALPSLAWLSYVGLSVPAAVVERLDYRYALGRGMELARADYVHVLGSIATLVICYVLSGGVLFFLLRGQARIEVGVAAFVADLVITPTIFLGAALLYFDQAARLDKVRGLRERSADADLHHADDADGSGRSDVEVEPRPTAGSKP